MPDRIGAYFDALGRAIREAECTDARGATLSVDAAFQRVHEHAHAAQDRGNKLMFIGNGGSAAIAGHFANDFSKNGGLRSTAFNDGAVLTCLGNDFGYEHVFSKQLEWHAREGDLLIAISSSGRSPNILNGVAMAREKGCHVVTLSGFGDDNPLRKSGDINFYVRSPHYGMVEVSHVSLIHAILDLDMGWTPDMSRASGR